MPGDLRAVLFDLDGTLVDTEGLWWQAYAEVTARLGGTVTHGDAEHVHGRTVGHTAGHLLRRIAGTPGAGDESGHATARRRRAADERGAGAAYGQDAVAAMLTDAFAERVERGVTVLPGALPLLDALAAADVATALVTASPRRVADTALRELGAHRFRLTVTADDTPRGKPDPDPYLLAMAGLGVEPGDCVAIEDSPTGLASAQAAGCAVLLIPNGGLERVNLPLLRDFVGGH